MRGELKKYSINTLFLLVGRIVHILSELFIGILIARYLGPEEYGLFSYILAIFYIFVALSKSGLDPIITKFLVNHSENESEILGSSFGIRLTFSLFLILICFVLYYLQVENFEYILILCLGLLPSSLNILRAYNEAKVISKYTVYAEVIGKIVSSIIKVAVLVFKLNLTILFAAIFAEIIIIPFLLLYYHPIVDWKKWKFSFYWAKQISYQAWSVLLTSIAVILTMRMDQLMIKNMIDDESLGYYSAAIKLCESWYFIPGIITSSVFPKLLELKNKNNHLFEERMIQGYSILIYLSILIAIVINFGSEQIISFLFGEEYISAASIVSLYVWSGVFIAVGYLNGKWFYANNLETYKFFFTVCGLIVNLVCNYLFIKEYGFVGAAYATLVSLTFYVFILNILFKKTRKNFFLILKGFNPLYLVKGKALFK